ncbi:hypothetical protein WOSG25_110110 [Weissella oryzae SG25]|uniref:Uncharacterized protein n=1 Tax=Weissella oryzae (strain DSM 25784 / JCM 18191 / LMG 30913 / SG25) TaxID=1329250 RepID=A0A069CWC8_WEIOS|nr:hypothetical protein [Weissella oryzae]GAK31533.1 hypothetical protein WOSG25_110110 [Weissella oryzae SG25]
MVEKFKVLELWPGIYLQTIGDDFRWSVAAGRPEYAVNYPNNVAEPRDFVITNDLNEAKDLLTERYNELWIDELKAAFPKAKVLEVTQETRICEVTTNGTN